MFHMEALIAYPVPATAPIANVKNCTEAVTSHIVTAKFHVQTFDTVHQD